MEKTMKKVYEKVKSSVVDGTGALTLINPIATFYENVLWGMPDEVSLKARLINSAMICGGIGRGLAKLRDYSKKKFKITDKSPQAIQFLHDIAYVVTIGAPLAALRYWISGATPEKILYGTGTAMVASAIMGGPTCYAFDLFRDLTGTKKSERIPKCISNLPSKTKKGLAVLLFAGSIAACGLMYNLTPDKKPEMNQIEKAPIEAIVDQCSEEAK